MCLVLRFNKIKFSCFVMVDSIKLIEVCERALWLLKVCGQQMQMQLHLGVHRGDGERVHANLSKYLQAQDN